MDLSKKSDSDLLESVNRLMRDSWSELPKWRKEAREMYAFEAGDQWSREDKDLLMEQGRPAVTFNRVSKVIDAAAGSEVVSRQAARYLPRNPDDNDPKQAEVWNSAARWMRDDCNAEDEESDAFRDMLICGMGWTETKVDYTSDPDGMVVIQRMDPLEMRWDMSAKRRNIADSRWRLRERWVPRDEIKAQWPDADLKYEIRDGDELWQQEPHDADNAWKYEGMDEQTFTRGYDPVKKEFRLIEFQWWEYENYEMAAFNDGGYGEVKPENEWQIALDDSGNPARTRQKRRVYHCAIIAGQNVLDRYNMNGNDWSFKPMTGKREVRGNSTLWYGLMRPMRDPQLWANKFFSTMMHIFSSGSKGGFFFETGALADPTKAREDINRPEGMVELNPGGLAKIQERSQFQVPANVDRLLQYSIQAIPDTSGVNMEFMGLADRQQAGVTEYARQKAALGILSVMFDALRHYRKDQARLMLRLMNDFVSDKRLIRVMGPAGPNYVPLAKEGNPKYDIIIDEQPVGPNAKTETWAMMAQLLPVLKDQGVPASPELLDYLPLPSSLVEKWKERWNDPRIQEMEQAMQQLQAENEELKLKKEERIQRETTRQVDSSLEDDRDRQRIELEKEKVITDRMKALNDWRNADGNGSGRT